MKLRRTIPLLVAMLATLAFAGTAQATTFTVGHYDLLIEADCSTRTAPLAIEDHNTGTQYPLAGNVFQVDSGNTVSATSRDRGRFASGPGWVLTNDDSLFRSKLILGGDIEYANCRGSLPQTTVTVTADSVPAGGRAAAYPDTSATTTQLDTDTGAGLNTGLIVNGHEDRRWGFTAAGTYRLELQASTSFRGGATVVRETIEFEVR